MTPRILAAAAALAIAGCAQDGADRPAAVPAASADGDMAAQETAARAFAPMAASGGMYEVQSSLLALDRSRDHTVRAVARRMIEEHQRVNQDLAARATTNNIRLPQHMTERHRRMLDDLAAVPPAEFDGTYLRQQDTAHREAVALFSNYARNGDNAELRDFATRTLPALERHREMVRSALQQVGDRSS